MRFPKFVFFWVAFLFVYTGLSINIYLPAVPELIHALHTSDNEMKFSITLFLTSFSLSQLFWGVFAEKFGRRKPIIAGAILSMMGVALAMFSHNLALFNYGRIFEALGLGMTPVIGRAILMDITSREHFSQTMSIIAIIVSLMPALAPIIGGYLQHWFGWRAIFLFLLLYGCVILYGYFFIVPETNTSIRKELKLSQALQDYQFVICNRKYLGYLFTYILLYGGMVGYYTATPFIFIKQLHIPAWKYGFYSLFTVGTYIAGALISRINTRKHGIQKLITFGCQCGWSAAVLFLGFSLFAKINVPCLLIPMMLYTFATGIISPNANAGAMLALVDKVGPSAAIIGIVLYSSYGLFSWIACHLSHTSLTPLACYIAIITCLASMSFFGLVISFKKPIVDSQSIETYNSRPF